jgi:hypothetical protein
MTNPIVWYYGCVAEMYTFDLFCGAFLVYVGISAKKVRWMPISLALIIGVRPSSGVLLLPLYLFLIYHHLKKNNISSRTIVIYHILALLITMAWLIPMIQTAGGIKSYLDLYRTHDPVEPIGFLQNIFRMSSYMAFTLPLIIFSTGAFLWEKLHVKSQQIQGSTASAKFNKRIILWWLVPPMLFFTFVHYSKGYILLCITSLFILIIFLIKNLMIRERVVIITVAFQIIVFLFVPYGSHPVETYFSKEQRTSNIFRLWVERTGSQYLMARSKILEMQDCMDVVEEAISLLEHESQYLEPRKLYLCVDPATIIAVRALQAKYEKIQFTKILLRENDQYGYHFGFDQEARGDIATMLGKALIITPVRLTVNYLSHIHISRRNETDHWTYYTVTGENAQVLADRYSELFSRK